MPENFSPNPTLETQINPSVPAPLTEYVIGEVNSMHALVEQHQRRGIPLDARTADRFAAYNRVVTQLSQPQPSYQDLHTALGKDILEKGRKMQEPDGKFSDDDRYFDLENKADMAEVIRHKLTEPQDQEFMRRIAADWTREKMSTQRGIRNLEIEKVIAERARLMSLFKLIPGNENKAR